VTPVAPGTCGIINTEVRPFSRLALLIVAGGVTLALGVVLLTPSVRALAASERSSRSLVDDLRPLAQRSVVYARDGSLLAVLHAEEDRDPAKLSEVPQSFINAVVDTEDRAFYRHGGVDMRATMRALLVNTRQGDVTQGGSTITQQLIKNSLLTPRRSIDRKLREAILALRLEGELDKNEILERYLNTVYFGQGAYGVRAAAERFFNKELRDLTTPEVALLAGQISDPAGYDPFVNPDRARSRRAYVLNRMVAEGDLAPTDADRYAHEALPAAPANPQPKPDSYFVQEVQRRLLADDSPLGDTYQERYERLFRGGLRIITTQDPVMQAQAERAVRDTLPVSPFTAALVAMDPANGEVKALVGGPNFERAKFNLATQGARQPGSSFKVVTLAAALEAGYSVNDIVNGSAPCTLRPPEDPFTPWKVTNSEPGEGGVMPLHSALAHSLNCAFARLIVGLGPEKVVAMAKRLGVQSPLDVHSSITLGTEDVSPLDMVTVMSTLANEGVRHLPSFVRRIDGPDGKTIFREPTAGTRVLDAELARTETSALREVVTRGTGRRADIGRPVAGKTGTTDRWRDAWFNGYTPQLAASVWMGSPVGQVSMASVGSVGHVFGGTYPAMIWAKFMKAALAESPVRKFEDPDKSLWPKTRYVSEKGRTNSAPPSFKRKTTTSSTPTTISLSGLGPATTVAPTTTRSSPSTTATTSKGKGGGG